MLRILLSTLSVLAALCAVAQSHRISGRVMDDETGAPVRYAQIYFSGTFCGTATNAKGEFELRAGECYGNELTISAIPYKTTVIRIDGMEAQPVEVSLQKKQLRKTFRPDQTRIGQIIESALTKIPENYYTANFSASSFHREYVKSFDNIVQISEGVLHSNASGESYSVSVEDAFYAEDKDHREHFWNPVSGGFYTFGWNPVAKKGVPSKENFLALHLKDVKDFARYYETYCAGLLADSSQTFYVIHFDQKDNIKGALLKGALYIDSASHAIVKIDYSLSPKGASYILPNRTIGGVRICRPPLGLNILRESGEVNYRRFGNRWYMANEVSDTYFNASLDSIPNRKDEHFMKLHAEKIVTVFDTATTHSLPGAVKPNQITQNYLKRNFENYQSEKTNWPEDIVLKSDTTAFEVMRVLRLNNQLWLRKEGRKAWDALESKITFTPAELKEDLTYLKDMFFKLHTAFADPVKKEHFTRMIGNAERHIQRTMSETEFSKYLSPVIESIHCGHTQVYPSSAMEEYNRKFGKFFPFEMTVIGRRAFLTQDVADSAKGSEILKINGLQMSSILQNLRQKASTEGTAVSAKDQFVAKHFADLYNRNYLPTDSFKVELKDWNKKYVAEHTFAAVGFRLEEEPEEEIIKRIDSIQTVVLRPPSFLENAEQFFDKTFSMLGGNGISNLIIDLRENTKFRTSDAVFLYSHLTAQPFSYYDRMEMRSADSSLFEEVFIDNKRMTESMPEFARNITKTDTVTLYSNHASLKANGTKTASFNGNVYILVNGGSSSEAIDFARSIQLLKRGTVIGQEAATSFHGSCDAGEASIILPNSKLRITLPFATYRLATRPMEESLLHPDHVVHYTIAEIIEKRDKEMEICRDLIVANCCTAKSN
jgi:hypothetical protein